MAIKITKVTREFTYKGNTLPDPNPNLSPDQVRELYAAQYPELINGVVTDPEGDDPSIQTYGFQVSAGTKG